MNVLKMLSLLLCFVFSIQPRPVLEFNNKFICPMNNGQIKLKHSANSSGEIIDPKASILIIGSDERIISCCYGEVKKIKVAEDSLYTIIMSSSKYYFVYVGLNTINIKENQKIDKWQIIGTSYSKTVEFLIYKDGMPIEKPETILNCKCAN